MSLFYFFTDDTLLLIQMSALISFITKERKLVWSVFHVMYTTIYEQKQLESYLVNVIYKNKCMYCKVAHSR